MQGLIIIKNKGKEENIYFSGMKYGETASEYLNRHHIEYEEILERWDED